VTHTESMNTHKSLQSSVKFELSCTIYTDLHNYDYNTGRESPKAKVVFNILVNLYVQVCLATVYFQSLYMTRFAKRVLNGQL